MSQPADTLGSSPPTPLSRFSVRRPTQAPPRGFSPLPGNHAHPGRVSHPFLLSTRNSWASSRAPQTHQSKQAPSPNPTPAPVTGLPPAQSHSRGKWGGQHKWGSRKTLKTPIPGHVEIHTDAFFQLQRTGLF